VNVLFTALVIAVVFFLAGLGAARYDKRMERDR
jgi:hypothetical protein